MVAGGAAAGCTVRGGQGPARTVGCHALPPMVAARCPTWPDSSPACAALCSAFARGSPLSSIG